jgi:hypothetical protein
LTFQVQPLVGRRWHRYEDGNIGGELIKQKFTHLLVVVKRVVFGHVTSTTQHKGRQDSKRREEYASFGRSLTRNQKEECVIWNNVMNLDISPNSNLN